MQIAEPVPVHFHFIEEETKTQRCEVTYSKFTQAKLRIKLKFLNSYVNAGAWLFGYFSFRIALFSLIISVKI